LLFGAPLHLNLAASLPVFLLSVVIAISIGLFAAALQLAIQKGSAVVWALGSVWFLTGTMFPVQTLPQPLRNVAQLIPITHSLEGMRLALLEGVPLRGVGHELLILATFAIVLVPSSLAFFSWTLRRARIEGTLSFY
jgi:ABC-2 type transport system permease protein